MHSRKCKELAHQLANWLEDYEVKEKGAGDNCYLCFVCRGTGCVPEHYARDAMDVIGFEQGTFDELKDIIDVELDLLEQEAFVNNQDRIEFLRNIASS